MALLYGEEEEEEGEVTLVQTLQLFWNALAVEMLLICLQHVPSPRVAIGRRSRLRPSEGVPAEDQVHAIAGDPKPSLILLSLPLAFFAFSHL